MFSSQTFIIIMFHHLDTYTTREGRLSYIRKKLTGRNFKLQCFADDE